MPSDGRCGEGYGTVPEETAVTAWRDGWTKITALALGTQGGAWGVQSNAGTQHLAAFPEVASWNHDTGSRWNGLLESGLEGIGAARRPALKPSSSLQCILIAS